MTRPEPPPLAPWPELLPGTTVAIGTHRYRLERVLGGGLTAVVLLALPLDPAAAAGGGLALKVARDAERHRRALGQEQGTLEALESAERGRGTHYFPRVRLPLTEIEVPGAATLASRRNRLLALGLELVSAPGVHDLLLDWPPGRPERERLALAVACQYADMLGILHGAGLSCADRKLADLRWTPAAASGSSAARQETGGRLLVLDWNVTAAATAGEGGTIAFDLFRFGLLWHHLLLGIEPRSSAGGGGQIEQPLQLHPAWRRLSYGTGAILGRLLHPSAAQRYREAGELLGDLVNQRDLWQAPTGILEARYRAVLRRYVEAPANPPPEVEIKAALAAVDVLRLREKPSAAWEQGRRGLLRAAAEAPLFHLQAALHKAQWQEAVREAARIQRQGREPAVLMQSERYGAIAAYAEGAKSSRQDVKPWLDLSDRIFRLDAPDGEAGQELEGVELLAPKAAARTGDDSGIESRLLLELRYRVRLSEARARRDQGSLPQAQRGFAEVASLRDLLSRRCAEPLACIDRLYGDPSAEAREVSEAVAAGEDAEHAFRRALTTLRDRAPLVPDAQRAVAAALRIEPDSPLLIRAHLLLLAEERYRESRGLSDLPLEDHALRSVEKCWEAISVLPSPALASRPPAAARGGTTDLAGALADLAPAVQAELERRRGELDARRETQIGLAVESGHLVAAYLCAP